MILKVGLSSDSQKVLIKLHYFMQIYHLKLYLTFTGAPCSQGSLVHPNLINMSEPLSETIFEWQLSYHGRGE